MSSGALSKTVDGLQGLIGLVKSTPTTVNQSGSRTQTKGISQEGLNALLTQILSNVNGLASVASGQRSAGLYNSSTNQLLINDLLTRAAGEVQARNETTTDTQNQTTTTTKEAPLAVSRSGAISGIGTLLATKAAGSLLGPTVKRATKNLPSIGDLGESISSMLFPTPVGQGVDSALGDTTFSSFYNSGPGIDAGASLVDAGGGGFDLSSSLVESSAGAGAVSSLIDSFSASSLGGQGVDLFTAGMDNFTGAAIGSGVNAAAGEFITSGFGEGVDAIASGADNFTGGALDSAGFALPGGSFSAAKNLLEGDAGGAAGALAGAAIGQALIPVPVLGSAIGSFVGESLGSGCFITTAVCYSLGRRDDCKELQTLRSFRDSYMQETPERKELIKLYYAESPAILDALEDKFGLGSEAFTILDERFIQPAVKAIDNGLPHIAFDLYVELFKFAKLLSIAEPVKTTESV